MGGIVRKKSFMILKEEKKARAARAPLEEQKLYCPENHTAQRRSADGRRASKAQNGTYFQRSGNGRY